MTMNADMLQSYTWAGGQEFCIRFGPDTGPLAIAALPLFEEANRTRAFTVTILRALANRGIASLLPDFPGTGESLVTTGDTTVSMMREAYRALADDHPGAFGIALRSGALLDMTATLAGRWHLAPQTGAGLLRDLNRIRAMSAASDGYAGNILSDAMLADLAEAMPASNAHVAQPEIAGAPLWRRAEPDNDVVLAQRLADDIADWIASCAG